METRNKVSNLDFWLKIIEVDNETIDTTIHKWKDKHRRLHPVKEMSVSYIKNCINGFKNGTIPHNWHGGSWKWIEIFEKELISRQ